jgi:hypothetical protein
LSAPLLHAPQERMRLGFILVPGGAGSR